MGAFSEVLLILWLDNLYLGSFEMGILLLLFYVTLSKYYICGKIDITVYADIYMFTFYAEVQNIIEGLQGFYCPNRFKAKSYLFFLGLDAVDCVFTAFNGQNLLIPYQTLE